MKLDPHQSHYVLQALLARRKVLARHVQEILQDRKKEIASLRERLAMLERLGGQLAGRAAGRISGKRGGKAAGKARRRRRLSPKVRALRRQQGRYMGLVRRLSAAKKAQVKAIREKKGLPAAIQRPSPWASPERPASALEPDSKRSRLDYPSLMAERKTDPPASGKSSHLEAPRTARKLKPEHYELKIRWEKARQVLDVSPTGVRFDFDAPLKVGTKYPISLTAPGVSVLDDPRGLALPAHRRAAERPLLSRDRALLPLRGVTRPAEAVGHVPGR